MTVERLRGCGLFGLLILVLAATFVVNISIGNVTAGKGFDNA